MISASVEPLRWPRRRWWVFILVVFGVQVGLIFWLSDRSPLRPRPPASVPVLRLAGNAPADTRGLEDPTLFALPHRQGFSGLAWLKIPPPPFRSFEWSEEPRWLQLSAQRLGAILDRPVEPDDRDSPPTLARPEPRLMLAQVPPLETGPERSLLRLEGDLARRRLITHIELPSRPANDLLTNSVVQVVVDTDGRVVSVPILLPPGSGDRDADLDAVKRAKTARFEPEASSEPAKGGRPMPHLTWGRMVFEWHTVPALLANPPSSGQ